MSLPFPSLAPSFLPIFDANSPRPTTPPFFVTPPCDRRYLDSRFFSPFLFFFFLASALTFFSFHLQSGLGGVGPPFFPFFSLRLSHSLILLENTFPSPLCFATILLSTQNGVFGRASSPQRFGSPFFFSPTFGVVCDFSFAPLNVQV